MLDLTQATLQEWALKNGIDADVKSMSQAEKTLLRYQYVMSQTRLIQGDFLDTADTWANQVKILKQQFQALGAVIGGGLINALKPFVKAMNTALSGIISFAKTVMNALGKIFGWEYEITSGGQLVDDATIDAIEDEASGLDDVADSAGKAADKMADAKEAAEDYKNTVLGFDELNKLNDTTEKGGSSSSPSGGSGSGKTGKASALPTGGAVNAADVQVSFKRTKALYESEIDTLYDLGKYISKTLTKAMNSIDWDSIYEKARGFGTGLANFLNGLINPQLFSALGKTIANSLNTVIYGLNAFAFTFDFKNLGTSIGTGINSMLIHFDFNALAEGLATWKNNLWDAFNSFVSTVNWGLLGVSITDGINTYLKTIDWTKRTSALVNFGLGLLRALTRVFTGIQWGTLLDGIKEAFKEIDFTEIGTTIITTLWAGLTGDEMSNSKKEQVFASLSTLEEKLDVLTEFTFDALYDLYNDFLKPVGEWILGEEGLPKLAGTVSGFFDLVDWNTLTTNLKKFWGALARFTIKIGTGLIDFIDKVNGPLLALAINGFATAMDWLADVLNGMSPGFLESLGSALGLVVTAALGITHPVLAGILGLSIVLGRLNRQSEARSFADSADEIADGIKKVSGELDLMEETATTDYTNISDTLDKFYELNTKLKNGGYLNPQEAAQYEEYKKALSDYSGAIKTEFEKIGGYYDGTKKHLEDLIAIQYNQILLTGYQSAITKYAAAAAEASTQLELSKEALVGFLSDKAFLGTGLDLNNEDYSAIADFFVTGEGQLTEAQAQFVKNINEPNSQALGFGSDALTDIRDDFVLLTDAIYENAESYKTAQHEIEVCQKSIRDLETKLAHATTTTKKESGAIDTAVKGTGKNVAHVITETGEVVETGTARPWKNAYKEIKNSTNEISKEVESSSADTIKSVENASTEITSDVGETMQGVNATVSDGLDDVNTKIETETPKVEETGRKYGNGAGGGIGKGFMFSLEASNKPIETEQGNLMNGIKTRFMNFFGIKNGISTLMQTLGLSFPAGLNAGTNDGTPSLLNTFATMPWKIKQSLGDIFSFMKPSGVSLVSGFETGAENQAPWAISAIVGIKNSLVGAFNGINGSMWGVGHDAIVNFRNGITSVHIPVPHIQTAGSVLSAIGGAMMTVPQYNVAWYKQGGLATSSSIVGVGEAGHEGILPLTNASVMQEIAGAIVAGMVDSGAIANAVTKGMVAAGQNDNRPVIVNATLRTENDEVLARAVTRGQQKLNYRTSPVAP